MFALTKRTTALILTFLFVFWGVFSTGPSGEQLIFALIFGIWAMLTKDK